MRQGLRMPAQTKELCAVDDKFGYDKKLPYFMYLIDGKRYKLQDVLDRTRLLDLKDSTVARRLIDHSSNTWAEILRPAQAGKARNEADKAARSAKQSKKRTAALIYRRAMAEKRAYFAGKKQGHKEL